MDRKRVGQSGSAARRTGLLGGWLPLLLVACSTSGTKPPSAAAPALPVLHREDTLWLERVSFGLDAAMIAQYRALGRERFLDRQLAARDETLPAPVRAAIDGLEVSHLDAARALAGAQAENKTINAMANGADKDQARKAFNDHAGQLAAEAVRRELLRAVYSPAQLDEQMVWFWLNHFSVHQNKADLRWLIGDYEEHAIRPHALGHFKDLVLATLEHPAMLQYLDNNQNAAGHINENYARELMELHTLGVDGGYSQQDVQRLAHVLTGVGINTGTAPKLKPEQQNLYRREGAFEFNPARHDFAPKVLLGQTVQGRGLGEVEDAVGIIVKQPACARFISRQLASYFVADDPPPQLVERMSQTFLRTDGDIAAVLRTMFLAHEIQGKLGSKFKDPMRFVISAVRFAYDGRAFTNTRPLQSWLNGMGEAPFGRQTPDGYPLTEVSWSSSGQMSRRFEIARLIGSGNAGLFDKDPDPPPPAMAGATPVMAPAPGMAPAPAMASTPPAPTGPPAPSGFPQLSNRLYYEAVEPFLAAHTREALNRANSQQEWNTFLLSSPEFNYE